MRRQPQAERSGSRFYGPVTSSLGVERRTGKVAGSSATLPRAPAASRPTSALLMTGGGFLSRKLPAAGQSHLRRATCSERSLAQPHLRRDPMVAICADTPVPCGRRGHRRAERTELGRWRGWHRARGRSGTDPATSEWPSVGPCAVRACMRGLGRKPLWQPYREYREYPVGVLRHPWTGAVPQRTLRHARWRAAWLGGPPEYSRRTRWVAH